MKAARPTPLFAQCWTSWNQTVTRAEWIALADGQVAATATVKPPEPAADYVRELEAIAVAASEVCLAWESDQIEQFVEASDQLSGALRPWRKRRADSISSTKEAL